MPYEDMTMEELTAIYDEVGQVLRNRRAMGSMAVEAENLSRRAAAAAGIKEGDPWEQPVYVGYPMGWRVTHADTTWWSTIPNNVFEPGVSGWREETPIGGAPPAFRRPSGAHDAYQAGERITWTNGSVYQATRNGVDWDPVNSPSDWELVIVTEPEPDPVEPDPDAPPYELPPDYEPEPEPEIVVPWAANVAYEVDDLVVSDGVTYRVIQAHTSQAGWTPAAVPALFERVG